MPLRRRRRARRRFPGAGEYSARINWEDAGRHGEIDASTVRWWMGRDEEARRAVLSGPTVLLRRALVNLGVFVGGRRVWAKDPTLDLVILRHAHRQVGLGEAPWSLRSERSVRTIVDLAGDPRVERVGVAHNALDDALTQARQVIEGYRRLRAAPV